MLIHGSYLYGLYKTKLIRIGRTLGGLYIAHLDPLSAPITGCEPASQRIVTDIGMKIPCIMSGTVYTYLSNHIRKDSGAWFRVLMHSHAQICWLGIRALVDVYLSVHTELHRLLTRNIHYSTRVADSGTFQLYNTLLCSKICTDEDFTEVTDENFGSKCLITCKQFQSTHFR